MLRFRHGFEIHKIKVNKMFVIVDMEWVTNAEGYHSPTQLSAARVDKNRNMVDEFSSFIRPRDGEFHVWDHVAYTGGERTEEGYVFLKFVARS